MKTWFFFFAFIVPALASASDVPRETATFGAGCFWGVEEFFRKIPGVLETKAGFMGGAAKNVKYEDTHDGKTGHAEVVQIVFDPSKVKYEFLLDQFFKFHDPTTKNRQGNDVGNQYRSVIFADSEAQFKAATAFKEKVNRSKAWKRPVVTQIQMSSEFWPAEEEHQKYLIKNPGGYDNHYIRKVCFDEEEKKK